MERSFKGREYRKESYKQTKQNETLQVLHSQGSWCMKTSDNEINAEGTETYAGVNEIKQIQDS